MARKRLNASDRQARAVDLYTQGWSFRRIAAELGYAGPSGVAKAIQGAIAKAPSRAVNDLRSEVEERARTMLEQLMPIVVNKRADREDRINAIDRVIKIDRELRRLHGLDAPTKNEHTGKDGAPLVTYDLSKLTDAQLERLINGDTTSLSGGPSGGDPEAGQSGEGAPSA